MASPIEDSFDDDLVPMRIVQVKNHNHLRNESRAIRTGVMMPTYTIQHDAPWMSSRGAMANPLASGGCDNDDNDENDHNQIHDDLDTELPPVPPLAIQKSRPQPPLLDSGPTTAKPSRNPLFRQVRSMLHKPSTSAKPLAKWDPYSGELSEQGKPAQVKPSTYVPPVSQLQARGISVRRPGRRVQRDMSPVSIMRAEEIASADTLTSGRYKTPSELDISPPTSPASISTTSTIMLDRGATPVSMDSNLQPAPSNVIRRKAPPAPAQQITPGAENLDPQRSPATTSDWDETASDSDVPTKDSHFSWTTYAPSVRPRTSNTSTLPHGFADASDLTVSSSRFSWSTVNTAMTNFTRPNTPPSEPLPAIPAMYMTQAVSQPRGPPVQSITSRSRPVPRAIKEDWTPPPRDRSAYATPPSDMTRLKIPKTASRLPSPSTPTSGGKALPLPPSLASSTPLSHLDSLFAREKDLVHQRNNIERGINQEKRVVNGSPLVVSFADVRAAKKTLTQYEVHLSEILLEVREVGVAISRARRKEGEDEGLWVRRVTH